MEQNIIGADSLNKEEYARQHAWGLLASINLYDCDRELISSPEMIKKYVVEICEVINMVRHGDVLIDRFGQGTLEGYSVMQFIETSSITAHFDEEKNRAFIDIFSCKFFEADKALEFSKNYFKAKRHKIVNMIRK